MKVLTKSTSLGEVVLKMVREKKTETKEFEALCAYYGKERLRKLYYEELEKEKERKLKQPA